MGGNTWIRGAGLGLSLAGLGACSTIAPRPFTPVSSPPQAASQPEFVTAFRGCVDVVTQGKGRVEYNTNVGTIVGATVGAPVAGAGLLIAGFAGAVVLAPAAVLGAGIYGLSRGVDVVHRDTVEGNIQAALTKCMAARGYTITDWTIVADGRDSDFTTPVLYPSRR